MSARDVEQLGPAPSWIWDPARQRAVWANGAAKALFAALRPGASAEPLQAADPVAALSNACHATLIAAGRAEYGPARVMGRSIRCRFALRPLDAGGAGILIEVIESRPADAGDDGAEAHLARAAHDLRTPLTAIVGFAEFMAASGAAMSDATRREYLSDIADAGRYAARMAEDLLTFSGAGRVIPGTKGAGARADLAWIANATARLLTTEAEARIVRLTVDIGPASALVAAEPDQIRRAVGNLAVNALAHARRAASISVREDREGDLAISVADDGPGLSPEDLALALQPFGRPNAPADSKGVGLGLPIARRFAEANGARLEIETAPGAGLTARILFPRERRLDP